MIFEKEHITDICFNQLKPLWLSTTKVFPDFMKAIPIETKRINESFIQKRGKKISRHFSKNRLRKSWAKKTKVLMSQFIQDESILNISSHLSSDTLTGIETELMKFLSAARQFAPDLPVANLGQAARNYLVYAMFLELIGKNQSFTPAILGYSMLYPITDNYIDSQRTNKEKNDFNILISNKIKGEHVSPVGFYDIKACELLSYIEDVYPRDRETDIYSGLMLMLEAQQESMKQQSTVVFSAENRLDISLFKGGVSVLIDRYMADARITEDELRFFLGFGFILQLADDLQDISSDLSEGNQTLFTLEQNPDLLEALVNQLLQFVQQLFQSFSFANTSFYEFLYLSTIDLLIMSIQMSQSHFNPSYLKKIEAYFPVSFELLEQYTKDSALYPADLEENDLLSGLDSFLKQSHTL